MLYVLFGWSGDVEQDECRRIVFCTVLWEQKTEEAPAGSSGGDGEGPQTFDLRELFEGTRYA